MQIFKRLFFVILLGLSACSSIPKADSRMDLEAKTFRTSPDKSVIYIYRDEFFGGAVRMDILIDGFLLGEMRTNSYMRAVVKPGAHTVLSRAENSSQVDLKTEPGKIYYIWQEAKMGLMYAGTQLHEVSSEEGQKGVRSGNLVIHAQPNN